MNNLVDLSSIYGFSSFNNIKQVGGGKIFYYIDENGTRTGIVDPKISRELNRLLKTTSFDLDFEFIDIDGETVLLRKDGSGTIGWKAFISEDGPDEPDEQISATDDEELEHKTDTQLRASSSSAAAAGEEFKSKLDRPDTQLRATSSSAAPRDESAAEMGDESAAEMGDESAATLPSIPAQLSDPRRVIWRKDLKDMSVTLIVIPPFSAIKEDHAKQFVEQLGLIFDEKNMVVSSRLLSEKKPIFDITRNRSKKKREDEINKQEDRTSNLFSYFHVDRFIAVVCRKNNDHILYFVDISNGTLREILRVDYEIKDVVFNPIYSEDKIQFAIIGIRNYSYDWSLLDYSDSKITIKYIQNNLNNCAIAFSQDGKSLIVSLYDEESDDTSVRIHELENIDKYVNKAVIGNDRCDKIKLSPSGDLIIIKGLYGIYVYDERFEQHSDYVVDRDYPNFDDSNETVDYTDRLCELFIVDNFYTTFLQDLPKLCIALYTLYHNISCIHLCDVIEKKKFKQFVFPNLSINHMELYLDKIHLILSTNRGIYALNIITSKINKIMDRQSQPFGMIKNSMFCSDRIVKIDGSITNSLENIDLHQIENLFELDDPSARLLLSSSVNEGTLRSRSPSPSRSESPSTEPDTDTRASQGREKRPKKEYSIELSNEEYIVGSTEQPNDTKTLTLDDIESMIVNKQQDLEQNRSKYSESKKQRIESNIRTLQMKLEELRKPGGYYPIYFHHCY